MIGALTLDQLRVLVAAAEEGSFSAAGRRLGRVQSAVSQSVTGLETQLGVALFDRSGYRPSLTAEGRILAEQARGVLRGAARIEAIAAGARAGLEAELRLAFDPLVPTAPLAGALRDLVARHPDLPITFAAEGLGGPLRGLRAGAADLGVCSLLPQVPEDVIAVPLLRIRMVPVAAAAHSLAALRRPLGPGDLEPHVQLVLADAADGGGARYGVSSARLWRFADLGRRMDFLLAGFGWCRMPAHLVEEQIADGRLVALDIEDDSAPPGGLTIHAARRRDSPLGPAGRWLMDRLAGAMEAPPLRPR